MVINGIMDNMTRITNEVLEERLLNLTSVMEKGFEGVHDRQDTTNGNVIKNTAHRIESDQKEKDDRRYKNDSKWVLGFIGFGTLTAIIKLFIF